LNEQQWQSMPFFPFVSQDSEKQTLQINLNQHLGPSVKNLPKPELRLTVLVLVGAASNDNRIEQLDGTRN